ncbi:helix-turn-helix domain-containing protein [Streptomyces sp. NPDC050856]|uniref:MarR family transcriptional regulator n=1 Tax=Streptomyces sp. NPDC050856 TaxID=3154939 RepID=UPI003408A74A
MELLGTRLRHLLDLLDGGVAAVYADLGQAAIRPRYTPVVRHLAAEGPRSIRELAEATGVTHSAASQTVAQLVKDGLVTLAPDAADARRRVARLTPEAEAVLPILDTEWRATAAAVAELEAEVAYPLGRLVEEALAALARRSMRDRIADVMAERVTEGYADGVGVQVAGGVADGTAGRLAEENAYETGRVAEAER